LLTQNVHPGGEHILALLGEEPVNKIGCVVIVGFLIPVHSFNKSSDF